MTDGYNGWTNWATWNVALWIGNEEAIYKERSRQRSMWTAASAKAFTLEYFPNGTPDMTGKEYGELANVDWQEIADNWNSENEDSGEPGEPEPAQEDEEEPVPSSLAAFIAAQGLTMECETTDSNPNWAGDDNRGASHYSCTIYKGRRRLTIPFSMGAAHRSPPDIGAVLHCLADDSSTIENARDFEDWCNELGYETDSRKAEKTFKACQRQARNLKRILGEESYETLLWSVTRE